MATTPRPQTHPLTRDLLAMGVVRLSADGTTLLAPDGTALAGLAGVASAATATVAGVVKQGATVANATDAATAITQLNALIASLRAAGSIA